MPLSREGFHLGVLWRLLEKTILGPPAFVVSLTAALAQTYGCIPPPFGDLIQKGRALFGVALLVAAFNLNKLLSKMSINNWAVPEPIDLADDILVVTGGSSGIGESLVKLVSSKTARARVVIVDIVPPKPELASLVQFYQCDLSDREKVQDTARRIKTEVGNPTVLVNNAGLVRGRLMSEFDWTDVAVTLGVNLTAPFLLIREFLPAMIARNYGHIVNVSSLSAFVPPAGLADYAASKAGLLAMTESLRLELRHVHKTKKVHVSALVLSFVRTPLFKGKTNQLEFISPLLHVDTCGEEILRILKNGSSSVRFMPGVAGLLGAIGSFPRWLQDVVLNETTKLEVDYKGRQVVDKHGRVGQR